MKMWLDMPRESGVYRIVCSANGKVYVGSAICLRKRVMEHRRLLNLGRHGNPILQASWTAHGEDAFTVEVVERCPSTEDALLAAEQRHIDALRKCASMFNVCPVAGTRRGAKMPPEAVAKIAQQKRGNAYRLGAVVPQEMRERIAEKLRGRHASAETKAKLSHARRGRPKSEAWKRKLSEIHKGREISPEQRAKIAAKLKGRKVSPEALAKRSATVAAKKAAGHKRAALSAESRAKQAAKLRGRKLNDETRAKMSAAQKGRSVSPDTKALIAEGIRRVWAARRAGELAAPDNRSRRRTGEVSHERILSAPSKDR